MHWNMHQQAQPIQYVQYQPFFGAPLFQPQVYQPFPPMQPAYPQYQVNIPQNFPTIIVVPPAPPTRNIQQTKHKPKEVDPIEVREFYYSNNRSLRKTRERFGIGYGRITNIINMHDTSRSHMITTTEEDDFIVSCASKGFLTSKDIVRMVLDTFGHKISQDTVTRRLKKAGYSFLKPRVIQQLSDDQKIVRFNFAINMLENYDYMFPQLIFSDESRFCDSPDSHLSWRKKNDFREEVTIAKSKKQISVMVWGAIGLGFKSKLYFHSGAVRSQEYKKCLEETNIFEDADAKFGQGNYAFQQDGATCHTTEDVINYILRKARMLHGWPPNSPDLSPIEMVWAHMKYRQSFLPEAGSKSQLKEQIQRLWDEIPIETINRLVLSFKYRLEMVRDVGGKSISHLLTAKKHDVPIDYGQEGQKLERNIVSLMYQLSRENRRKWKKIASLIADQHELVVSPLIIRHKVLEIDHKIKDYELYHECYEREPSDFIQFVNPENLEYDFVRNASDDEEAANNQMRTHVRIQISRADAINELSVDPEYLPDNQDSDWELSTDNEE